MISILIPTYNYNTLPLVIELHQQCLVENIAFEIIVLDDASDDEESILQNLKINAMPYCIFERNPENLGRTKTRTLLSQKAKFDQLLFLDADVFPGSPMFIKKYLEVSDANAIVFGGYQYENKRPENDKILRYVYGKTSEEKTAFVRSKNPYQYIFSGNFLINKNDFTESNFQGNEKFYGLDPFFAYQLMINGKKVIHIDNAVYHLGLDQNEVYFEKSLEAIDARRELMVNLKGMAEINQMTRYYLTLKKYKVLPLVSLSFSLFGPILKKLTLNNNPSMFCFKIYKLGYLCSAKKIANV